MGTESSQHAGRLRLLRGRDFRLLITARFTSALGTAAAPVALAFGVLESPGGAAWQLAAVIGAFELAQLVMLFGGGIIGDRFPRRRVLVGSDAVAGLAQAGTAAVLLCGGRPVALIPLALVSGAASATFQPAARSVVPGLVAPAQLASANAMLSVTMQAASFGGLLCGGLAVRMFGAGWVLVFDAATFGVSAATLLAMSALPDLRRATDERGRPGRWWADLRAGWHYFRGHRWIWAAAGHCGVVNACYAAGLLVLGPEVALTTYDGSVGWSAILLAQSAGTLLGAAIAAKTRPTRPIALAIAATMLMVGSFLALGLSAPIALAVAAGAVCGASLGFFDVVWNTTVQRQVAPDMLARVFSYDMVISLVLTPFSIALVAPLSDWVRPRWLLLGAGILVATSAAFSLSVPEVRGLRSTAASALSSETIVRT